MEILDATDRAPATMGGAAGQTLAGVISTSLHGSHFQLPPFPDWVRAIHLVGPDGQSTGSSRRTDRSPTRPSSRRRSAPRYHQLRRRLVRLGARNRGLPWHHLLGGPRGQKAVQAAGNAHRNPVVGARARLVDESSCRTMRPDAVQVAIDPGSMGKANPTVSWQRATEIPMSVAFDAAKARASTRWPLSARVNLLEMHCYRGWLARSRCIPRCWVLLVPAIPVMRRAACLPPALCRCSAPIIATDQAGAAALHGSQGRRSGCGR